MTLDLPMTLDLLTRNHKPSQIWSDKDTAGLPSISITNTFGFGIASLSEDGTAVDGANSLPVPGITRHVLSSPTRFLCPFPFSRIDFKKHSGIWHRQKLDSIRRSPRVDVIMKKLFLVQCCSCE